MEAAAVSVVHGAMGSLLGKLGDLLTAKYKLLKETRGHIMFLKAELESMYAFLKKISDMEDPDEQDKHWAKQVRELSYDIEDSVTEFMLRVESKSNSNHNGFMRFITKSMELLTTMNTRHEIAKQFEGLNKRVKEVSERRARYKIEDTAKPNNTTVDLRILALHAETARLVGVTGPRDDLIKLMDEEDVAAHQLKVLSIVGFGGLGKTTLANEIYRKIEGQFQCRAFVFVSQKPNIRKILRTVLSKVGFVPPENTNVELWEESELISTLQKFLLDKRYFIVVDDIWEAPVWEIIRCGLPKNMNGSRVITTTRIETVARACCINNQCKYVYNMKPLSEQDSRRLFFKRIFGSEDACPPHLEEVSTGILKRCGGLPLAIITISSLLASQPNKLKQQWEHVQNSLGSNFEVNPSLDGMRQILNLSYINIPHHLKACMLYLCIYPEDHTIDRDGLLRQWIAEGFIGKHHGIDSVDIARSYFNELVNRNMIQPVGTDYNGEVVSCRVHDMMLDLMQHISREENFVTVVEDDIQDLTRQLSNKIRRLSLNLDSAIDDGVAAESFQLSQTRMLATFGTSAYFPPLSLFKHLRVLTIEISDGPLLDLNGICHLFLLRYIKIKARGRDVVLPSKIGHLQQLETFEIDAEINSSNGQSLQELPSDVVHLSRLLRLIVLRIVKFPVGIGNMKSLHTLQFFDLTIISPEAIKGLGELTNLTDLRIRCDEMHSDKVILERGMEVLHTCLEKLSNLKYLVVWFHLYNRVVFLDPLSQIPASFCHLESFHGDVFSSVPGWIGRLCSLQDLNLGVNEVLEDDIKILAELPSLIHLWLDIWGTPKNTILIRRSGFPVLQSFTVGCNRMPCLALEAGAMSKLERLELYFNANGWFRYGGVPAGMEHLSSLKEISVNIGGACARGSNIRAAESAVWKAIDLHPGRPVGRVKVETDSHYCFYRTDGKPDEEEAEEEDVDGGSSTLARSST